MVAHVDGLHSVNGTLLGFLKFWVKFDLKMVEVIHMIRFSLDVTSRLPFFIASSHNNPVRLILSSIIIHNQTHFLRNLISIAAALFINALMSIESSVLTLRHSSTASNVNL